MKRFGDNLLDPSLRKTPIWPLDSDHNEFRSVKVLNSVRELVFGIRK